MFYLLKCWLLTVLFCCFPLLSFYLFIYSNTIQDKKKTGLPIYSYKPSKKPEIQSVLNSLLNECPLDNYRGPLNISKYFVQFISCFVFSSCFQLFKEIIFICSIQVPKISLFKHLIQSDPSPVILMSDISKQVRNSSWEQVHNVVENVITELRGNFNSVHTG